MYSTNPFCTVEFDSDKINYKNNYVNYTDCINNNDYDKECKKKYGNEYIFDNDIYNLDSVLNCDDGGKRVKCKLGFHDIIENFENQKNNDRLIFIIIFIFIIFIFIIFYFRK